MAICTFGRVFDLWLNLIGVIFWQWTNRHRRLCHIRSWVEDRISVSIEYCHNGVAGPGPGPSPHLKHDQIPTLQKSLGSRRTSSGGIYCLYMLYRSENCVRDGKPPCIRSSTVTIPVIA